MDQPGAVYAVSGLSAAQKTLLIHSGPNADRVAAHLAVSELILATSKVELKGLLWQVCLWAMQNECVSAPDNRAGWRSAQRVRKPGLLTPFFWSKWGTARA